MTARTGDGHSLVAGYLAAALDGRYEASRPAQAGRVAAYSVRHTATGRVCPRHPNSPTPRLRRLMSAADPGFRPRLALIGAVETDARSHGSPSPPK